MSIMWRVNDLLKDSRVAPVLMWTIGLALLTILIPLAIAILTDILQKKRGEDVDFAELDLHVILDHVLRFKVLLISTFLIFSPLFFWEKSLPHTPLKAIIAGVWMIGILLLLGIILDIYLWVKGNVSEFRFSYLKKLKKVKDLKPVWGSVWKTRNINSQRETYFFEIFFSIINKIL